MIDRFPRRASLEVLRAEAGDERSVLVHERLRNGQDPWDFMSELPSVDELVVLLLRADVVVDRGGDVRDPHWNDQVLRSIALEYPELSTTVWRMLAA
ncbi:tryptophan synthase subunit alpha [Microbacterium sp. Mu-80]|uniref:Tryptophan synthase subunit alpha n=1 Tax=Microbacterium bandirmense TaxID=3122050 RepID=A0ABU8LF90_9MICO